MVEIVFTFHESGMGNRKTPKSWASKENFMIAHAAASKRMVRSVSLICSAPEIANWVGSESYVLLPNIPLLASCKSKS